MGRLEGKTCLVTAAGQGIGRASAIMMNNEGARVIATDINQEALDELAALGIETTILNVRDPEAIAQDGRFDDIANTTQFLTGTADNTDTFVINGPSSDYNWGTSEDDLGADFWWE